MSEPKFLTKPDYEKEVMTRWKENAKRVIPDLDKRDKTC